MSLPDSQKRLFRYAKGVHGFRKNEPEDGARHESYTIDNKYGGGYLYISEQHHQEFLNKYVDDIKNGQIHYLRERRTRVFHMFCELHIERKRDRHGNIEEDVAAYAHVIHSAVRKFYPSGCASLPSRIFDIIALRTPTVTRDIPSSIEYDDIGELPTMTSSCVYRLVWPHLYTNQANSLVMRGAIISRLMNEFPQYEWPHIVTEEVFMNLPVRMPYSHESLACTSCNGDEAKRMSCVACDDGWVSHDNPFTPYACFVNGNQIPLPSMFETMHEAMPSMTIRSFVSGITPGWTVYEGAPSAPSVIDASRQCLAPCGIRDFVDDMMVINRIPNRIDIPRDDHRVKVVERFIRQNTTAYWSNVYVSDLYTTQRMGYFIARVQGEGSSFCLNVKADHDSNRIYFYITTSGITQKCFCRDGDDENACQKFQSKAWPISDPVKTHLWPPHAEMGLLLLQRNVPAGEYVDAVINILEAFPDIDVNDEEQYGCLSGESNHRARQQGDGDVADVAVIHRVPPKRKAAPARGRGGRGRAKRS